MSLTSASTLRAVLYEADDAQLLRLFTLKNTFYP